MATTKVWQRRDQAWVPSKFLQILRFISFVWVKYYLQGKQSDKKCQNSCWGEVNWCFTPFFNYVWLYMAVSFHSWRNKLFLGVNQQPSVSNRQLPLMGFEPQRRGASSFKARRLNHTATEAPKLLLNYQMPKIILTYIQSLYSVLTNIQRQE